MASKQQTAPAPAGRPGVVLAAGLGSRLARPGEETSAKPLLEVFGVPLLLRTLGSLELAGCAEVVVVLGSAADRVRQVVEGGYRGPLALHFVLNPDYRLSNGISVLCARERVAGREFVLTMADHVLDDPIMHLVRAHRPAAGGATLCVDYKVDEVFDLDDATKVLAEEGHIRAIGKQLETYNCIDTGVFVCTEGLMAALAAVRAEAGDASLSDGIQRLAAAGLMQALDVGDAFWQDVDTPEMMTHAEQVLALRARGGRG